MKKTCLNAHCPERTGGECTAGETTPENDELREEFNKAFPPPMLLGQNQEKVADWWLEKIDKIRKASFSHGMSVGTFEESEQNAALSKMVREKAGEWEEEFEKKWNTADEWLVVKFINGNSVNQVYQVKEFISRHITLARKEERAQAYRKGYEAASKAMVEVLTDETN